MPFYAPECSVLQETPGIREPAANPGAAFKHLGVFGVWLSELRKHKVPVMI
jgi:hypothetical protein